MIASLLVHPLALFMLAGSVALSVLILYADHRRPPPFSKGQLACGYAAAVIMSLLMVAVASYVSPEDALAKWKVPPERYWSAVLSGFLPLAVSSVYLTILGIAIIGSPSIYVLSRFGYATSPWVLILSCVISLVFAAISIEGVRPYDSLSEKLASFVKDAPFFVQTHLLLCLAFCVGARLPWTFHRVVIYAEPRT